MNIVLAVFTPEHVNLIGPMLKNLNAMLQTNVTIVVHPDYERVIKPYIANRDKQLSVSGVILSPDADGAFIKHTAEGHYDLARLWAWTRGIGILEFGGEFICLDLRTIMLRPARSAWESVRPFPFTLAMPERIGETGRRQYIPMVLFGRTSSTTKNALELLVRETHRIQARSDAGAILKTYGSELSAAYTLVKSQMDESGGAILGAIPQPSVIEKPPLGDATFLCFPGDPNKGFDGYDWFPVMQLWVKYRDLAA